MKITVNDFGKTSQGAQSNLYTLQNKNGMSVSITDFGGVITNLFVPDKQGNLADVVLAHAGLEQYLTNPGSFGACIGRNANRIAGAEIIINDQIFPLEKNDGANNLHTGKHGLQFHLFDAEAFTNGESVQLRLFTVVGDLEDGFPGNLEVIVDYTLSNDNALSITYTAVSDEDTIINLTNHSYFNLAGHANGSVEDHTLWVDSTFYSPNTPESIPTGELLSVTNSPFDFTKETLLGDALGKTHQQLTLMEGLDNNLVLNGSGYRKVATLTHPPSGRIMHVSTNLSAMHLYTGNFLPNPTIPEKDNAAYVKHGGVCFETQTVPNAAVMPWLDSPIYSAGQEYSSTTTFRFETTE